MNAYDDAHCAAGGRGIAIPRNGLVSNRADETRVPSAEELARLLTVIAEHRDRDAFAKLFTHLSPRLKAFLMKGGLRANAAEELVQDTMLLVWRKASRFDPSLGTASTWIFTIARNLRVDLARRERREAVPLPDLADNPAVQLGPDLAMLAVEREDRLRQALATLSDEQATVLRLSFFSEKPHPEISQELGIPLGTVKSRIRLAMDKLRVLLDDLT